MAIEQSTSAEAITPEQRTTLQLVYEIFHRDGVWPTFQYVDAALDRDHGIEFWRTARPLRTFLIQFDPHGQPGSQVFLTLRGIAACEGSRADQELFMRMLRWLLSRQETWRPSPTEVGHLRLSSEEARSEWWKSGYRPSDVDLLKAYEMATAEGLSSMSSLSQAGAWEIEPSNSLRQLRGVTTIAEYLAARHVRSEVAQTPTLVDPDVDEEFVAAPASSSTSTEDSPYIFILMPFGKSWSNEVRDSIFRACRSVAAKRAGLTWQRADDIAEPGRITDQIIASIRRADAIVADISGNNPNVMFELGFAHALGKPVVVLNQSIPDAPFDIKDWRQIEYAPPSLAEAEEDLVLFLESAFDKSAVELGFV